MLLSTSHKFIFCHIPKTAGSAIARSLQPYKKNTNRSIFRSISRRLPIIEHPKKAHFRMHDTAAKIQKKLSTNVYNEFFVFAVVRNPYDHAISHYEYLKQYKYKGISNKISNMSFSEYLEFRSENLHHEGKSRIDLFARLPNQSYWVTDCHNNIIVDKLLRFECINTEFMSLTQHLGLGDLKISTINKSKSRKKGGAIESYYNAETRKQVEDLYLEDFVNFGYKIGEVSRG